MIEPVCIDEAPEVALFMERVLLLAVQATEEEKASFLKNIRSNLDRWLAGPATALHLKYVENGALAGVVMVKDFWNLCHLFVAPELHRRGIGKALLAAAMDGCRGKSPRGALVLNSSRNAIGFYRRFGFTDVVDVPAPYRGVRFELRL